MARVTVEDCIDKVENKFALVMIAKQRSDAISNGSDITVEMDHDKNPVIALREIAESKLDTSVLENELIKKFQRRVNIYTEEVNNNYDIDNSEYEKDTIQLFDDNFPEIYDDMIINSEENNIDQE